MACPHVSGLAALLKSFRSDLRAREVRSIIESTVDYTGVEVVTGGRVMGKGDDGYFAAGGGVEKSCWTLGGALKLSRQ